MSDENDVTEDHGLSDDGKPFLPIGPDHPFVSTFQTFKLSGTPWFPFAITIQHPPPGCTITLHANGKWEGSIEGLRAAMAQGESWGGDGITRMFLWLLLRQMEADKRSW